jgi:hypothetical protein
MPTSPTLARIWRGRTRRDLADACEQYSRAEGIPPLEKTALGVQLLREDRADETWFTTISPPITRRAAVPASGAARSATPAPRCGRRA